jgi:drug/metabolite transporter (DMT)-like permease
VINPRWPAPWRDAKAAASLAVMVVLVFTNVVLRYALNSGIAVSEELSRWLFVWLTFLGGIVALHWVLFYGSIKYANVSIALVCFSTVGFFTSILDPLITGRRWLMRELLLGCAVMLGIWLIFSFDAAFRTGILLGLVSSFMAALFTVLNKILLRHHTAESLTRWEMTGGWLLLTALLPFWLHWFPASRLVPTLSDLGWLIFLGLFCTVFAFRLSMDALKDISPFTVNLSYNLEPVYGILLAFVLFEENKYLGKGFLPGMLIILATVVIQTLLAWRERRQRG